MLALQRDIVLIFTGPKDFDFYKLKLLFKYYNINYFIVNCYHIYQN